jgi:hypothetical protein
MRNICPTAGRGTAFWNEVEWPARVENRHRRSSYLDGNARPSDLISKWGLLAVVLGAIVVPGAAGAAVLQSATGSGTFTIVTDTGSGLRNFSFTAEKRDDGTTTGQMELVNRFTGLVLHADINCLNVVGNKATMSGVVTHTNQDIFETFSAVVFSVVDNGEGANAPPDLISLAFFDLPAPEFTCTTQFFPPSIPVEKGNVQVRSS